MTDALRDAEAAAHREVSYAHGRWHNREDPVTRAYYGDAQALAQAVETALDSYRDAIERRVREERGAEVRALADVVRRFMLYLDGYGYEPHGALAREFGPVESEGSSLSTEMWLDRVLRAPARAALKPFEEAQP